jgi:hypothetical protein
MDYSCNFYFIRRSAGFFCTLCAFCFNTPSVRLCKTSVHKLKLFFFCLTSVHKSSVVFLLCPSSTVNGGLAATAPPLLPCLFPRADPSLPLPAAPVLHRDPAPTRALRAAAALHPVTPPYHELAAAPPLQRPIASPRAAPPCPCSIPSEATTRVKLRQTASSAEGPRSI